MQPKNQNDGVRLSTRYQQYDFAKRHLGGFGGRKVFPIGEENPVTCKEVGSITAISGHDILKRCYSTDGLSPVLNTCGGGNTEGKFEIANTIDANYYKGINRNPGHASSNRGIKQYNKIRRLTPKECERLQGFPDDWTKKGIEGKISNSQRYKMCGNAVTVNVVKEIIIKLLWKK